MHLYILAVPVNFSLKSSAKKKIKRGVGRNGSGNEVQLWLRVVAPASPFRHVLGGFSLGGAPPHGGSSLYS